MPDRALSYPDLSDVLFGACAIYQTASSLRGVRNYGNLTLSCKALYACTSISILPHHKTSPGYALLAV